VARAEAYPHAKFRLDPPNRLAIVTNVTERQTDRTGQTYRTTADSIGQTVLQAVAQKQTKQENVQYYRHADSRRLPAPIPDPNLWKLFHGNNVHTYQKCLLPLLQHTASPHSEVATFLPS